MAKRTRKLGHRRLRGNWTPKRAHAFAMKRVGEIKLILEEIGYTYADVDESVVTECDQLIYELPALTSVLDEALSEGRSI